MAFAAATALAIIWLGFVWMTNCGLGASLLLLAAGIGLLLRFGSDEEGVVPGAIGAVLVLVVVLAGRLWITASAERRAGEQAVQAATGDDAMILAVAQHLAQERMDAGEPLSLPGGPLPEGVATVVFSAREEVPVEIWQEAEQSWQAMDEENRTAQKDTRARLTTDAREANAPGGLMGRFGVAGLFWAVAAVSATFMIGGRMAV